MSSSNLKLRFWIAVLVVCVGVAWPASRRVEPLSRSSLASVTGGCYDNIMEDCEVEGLLECNQTKECGEDPVLDEDGELVLDEDGDIVTDWFCKAGTRGYTVVTEEFMNCLEVVYDKTDFDDRKEMTTSKGRFMTQICYKYRVCGQSCTEKDANGDRFCQAGPSSPICPVDTQDQDVTPKENCRRVKYKCLDTGDDCVE